VYLLLLQPELLAIMRKMYDVCPKGCLVKFGAGLALKVFPRGSSRGGLGMGEPWR